MLNLLDPAYYHLRQSIEQYLRAYILDSGVDYHTPECNREHSTGDTLDRETLCRCLDGHGLDSLAKLCGAGRERFLDEHLTDGLGRLSHLAESRRYPQDIFQEWGSHPIDLVEFLDE
jgi:hypothetical protein